MQSYRGEDGGASSNPYAGGSRPGSEIGMYPTAGTEHGDVSRKYQSQYEETINPFEAFRGRVSNLHTSGRHAVRVLTSSTLGTNPRIPVSQPTRTHRPAPHTANYGEPAGPYSLLPLRYWSACTSDVHVIFMYS